MAVALIAIAACDGDNNLGDNIPPSAPPMGGAGDTVAITSNTDGTANVVTFNRATPGMTSTSVLIQNLMAGDVVVGGDLRPNDGQFYVVTKGTGGVGRVYVVNTTNGMASSPQTFTASGTNITLTGANFGVDFNPVPDRLRVVSDTGENLRINVANGATTVDGTIAFNTGAPAMGSPTPGATAVAYTNSFDAACSTTLFYIDGATDRLYVTSDPNRGLIRGVGANLGIGDITQVSGFEIATDAMGNNAAFAALTVGGTTSLYSINLSTGAATLTGTGNFGSTSLLGLSIASPATAPTQQMGNLVAVTENDTLVNFNSGGSPAKLCTAPVAITGLTMGEKLLDIDQRSTDGNVYGLTDQGRIYIVDPATGAASNGLMISNVTLSAMARYGIDFNPTNDQLRIVGTDNQNIAVVITPTTATGTVQTAITGGGTPSVSAVAYTNAVNGTTTTRLFDIDAGNDQLAIQAPPGGGVLTAPVSLGLAMGMDVESGAGLDINGLTNQAFAGLNLVGASATSFATIALTPTFGMATTPVATIAGTIAGGAKVRGFAIVNRQSQASQATLLAVTGNMFFTVRAQDPTTPVAPVATPTPITGLNSETIVGVDRRPANGLIYILTDASKLYTLNTTTGAATLVSTLSVPLDSSTSFGVDFNPVPDRLRITSAAGQNLRVNVDNGAVTVDGALNPGTPMVTAVAYANNSAFPSATTLFDIDTVANSLFIQNPPNAGTLVSVGSLGMATFTTTASFDIVGGDNTFALAALQPAGMMGAQSQLFRIDLAAGTATPQPAMNNTIGPMGTVVSSATFLLTQLP